MLHTHAAEGPEFRALGSFLDCETRCAVVSLGISERVSALLPVLETVLDDSPADGLPEPLGQASLGGGAHGSVRTLMSR
jgi:hypothetical protein